MLGYFDQADLEAMTKFLSDRQKSDAEWDIFRKKIPDVLLDKWRKIIKECWQNGFCAPSVKNNEITWKQIKSLPYKRNAVDGCSFCTNTFKGGTCMGRFKLKPSGLMFVQCWSR